jgi:hypothetical protein
MQFPRRSFTLQQAVADSTPLARLSALVRESSERLAAVQHLIPPLMRPAVRPGPIDEAGWCLLVDNSAAAAKLRYMAPLLIQALRNRGWEVAAIRVKIQKRL